MSIDVTASRIILEIWFDIWVIAIWAIYWDSVFRLLFICYFARETGWDWLYWCQLGGVSESGQRWCAVPMQRCGGYLEGQGLRERVSSNAADGWRRFILWGVV
jgi:hypothetical protein